jgi:hypothetical protein
MNGADLYNVIGNCLIAVGTVWTFPLSPYLCAKEVTVSIGRYVYHVIRFPIGRSQWPRGLRRRHTVARLLRSWVRIPLEAWMFVVCVVR